ncbi:hypothetical protein [Jannaschia sp. CCS1]|uniref:hypothetical protein n=1 Tax=Jannaschia sp. (strain CCS1) TaxID=290400 RepID=UPI000053C3AF|nr:hypothetical protein [Jannaschia sp. CCS1]ABD57061.1 hypothetical protein Jann_4144 [Jannaschia sp. CCS1]
MHALHPNSEDALAQLGLLAKSDRLPAREAARCAQLVDVLRRPARVCVVGQDVNVIRAMLTALIGEHATIASDTLPPALELAHGATVRTRLTLEDGTTLNHEGAPTDDLLTQAPLFMQLELPSPLLRDMSILVLLLDRDPRVHRPALSWAARRTEIAVWCTSRFSRLDAQIWSHVPQRLSHHAYLVETRSGDVTAAARGSFTDHLHLPIGPDPTLRDLEPLIARLSDDIVDGRLADLDSAQMLLHRLGHLQLRPTTAGETDPVGATRPSEDVARLRRILSEPVLFLQRRAGALAEDLAWADVEGDDDWPAKIRSGCLATAEGLRDRAQSWPDDMSVLQSLSAFTEEVCDAFLLLEFENGADQAKDAAALLYQMRCEIERVLFPQPETP